MEHKYVADKNKIAIGRHFALVVDVNHDVIALDDEGNLLEKSQYPERYIGFETKTWHDIQAVAAGFDHGLGITEYGNIISTYRCWSLLSNAIKYTESGGMRQISSEWITSYKWQNVCFLDACEGHVAVITKEGEIKSVTEEDFERSPADYKKQIEMIQNPKRLAVGYDHAAILLSNGRVQVVGDGYGNADNVSDWIDIVDIDAFGCYYSPIQTVGVTKNGFVHYTENYDNEPDKWHDIVSVSCGDAFIVALDKDGKVYACGRNDAGQCDVNNWPRMICAKGDFFKTVAIDEDGWIWMTPIGKTNYRIAS